ncbi:unnamed protein product, partial [Symbiodinium sp. CCMP2456]
MLDASTLLEVLVEHFEARQVRYPRPPARQGHAAMPVLCLQDLIPPAPVVSPRESGGPEVFDLDARQCLLPGSQTQIDWLLQRAPISQLSGPPRDLDGPERFAAWVGSGCVGRSPAPGEMVVLTSDGSFHSNSGRMGWGLVVSLVDLDTLLLPGQFIGCCFGDLDSLVGGEAGGQRYHDAYSAEVAGLCWSALAALQLAITCPVLFRSDCTSAMAGAQGTASMRADNLCQVARCLHAAAAQANPATTRYQHVEGHAGDYANELADALANHGARGLKALAPLRFDVTLSADLAPLQWLPHICFSRSHGTEVPRLQHQVLRWGRGPGVCQGDHDLAMRPFLRAFSYPERNSSEPAPHMCQWRMASFNVLSLHDGMGPAEYGAGIHGAIGRPSLLQQSLEAAGVVLAGFQECRTAAGSMRCGRYTRFSSGADSRSCFGVELWLHDDSPCPASSVAVLHSSPTTLFVSATFVNQPIRLIVAHAPHRAHTSTEKQDWWKRFSHLCHSYAGNGQVVLMIDANCRIGSETSQAVGPHQPDIEDESGYWFRRVLEDMGMWLPSTFEHCMVGDGGTLRQKRSGSLDRSDYIGIPAAWYDSTCHAMVEPQISAGHVGIDHIAVVLDVSLLISNVSRAPARAARINVRSLADPQNSELVTHIINSSPRPAWDVDVSEHAAVVVDHLYRELAAAFPSQRGRMRIGYLSESTSAIHRVVASLRHSVRQRRLALRTALLRCAWQAWQPAAAALHVLFSGRWLWQLETRYALGCMLLRRYGLLVRRACREDRNRMYAEMADEIATAAPNSMHGVVQKVLKPKKYRKQGNAPLPALYRPDGSQCLTQAEITHTWREHFRVLEGGLTTTPADLLDSCRQSQARFEGSDVVDAAHMPTWLGLEAALRHTAGRKAAGPDLLPPMLCKRFSPQLTTLLWPLLLKTVCGAAEAAGLKGGTLHHIGKPSPKAPHTCDAHRGILVQSAVAKAFHRSLRGLVVQHWQTTALPLQIGGKSGCSASFGHLCSRALLYFARSQGLSAALIFIDLSSAYYAVIRETLFGKELSSRPVHEIAEALGLDREDLQDIPDIVYADDLCIPVVCDKASGLRSVVSAVAADTFDTLTPHALRVNLGPTKTAAIMAHTGAGSRAARQESFGVLKGRVPVLPESKGLLWLDLVARYRHLGAVVTFDGSLRADVKHRLALARSAFRDGRRRLFACKDIPMCRRAVFFRSHVLSTLIAGIGSWPELGECDWILFSGGLLGLYRQLMGLRAQGQWNLTASQILSATGLPPADTVLHAERLRFLGQLVRHGPDELWALLGWYTDYQDAVRSAGAWLLQTGGSLSSIGPIDQHWERWAAIMR